MKNIFLGMNVIALLVLITFIGIGIYDLYLYYKGQKTLTQRLHLAVPQKAVRITILCVIMGLVWAILGPNYSVTVLPGIVLGHLLWNE